MHLRSHLWIAAGLLLIATAAMAGGAATAPVSAVAASGANANLEPPPFVWNEASPVCGAKAGAGHLAAVVPAAARPSTTAVKCGACSDAFCAGATYNAACAIENAHYSLCLSPLGTTCSSDGLPACQCWNGPLP
jgi:hypothetical protein